MTRWRKKTVLRRLISKYGPMNTELMKALEGEDAERGVEREIEENANKDAIDITPEPIEANGPNGQTVLVDPKTGEVKETKKAATPKPNF